jgi:hypothetical protein
MITNQTVAEKLNAYLQHHLTLAQLVDWAEDAMLGAEFADAHFEAIRDVVARLGVADVRAFGLTWEDCEHLLHRLGYSARISVVAA